MTIYTNIEDGCYQVVKSLFPTGLNIIIGYQNGPEPQRPYCVIELINHGCVGREETGTDGVIATIYVKEVYEAVVRFAFVGVDNDSAATHAGNFAADFQALLMQPDTQEILRSNNLSLMRKGKTKRVPKLRETKFYNSYEQDNVFAFMVETTQTAVEVDSVSMTGTYPPTTISQTINVP